MEIIRANQWKGDSGAQPKTTSSTLCTPTYTPKQTQTDTHTHNHLGRAFKCMFVQSLTYSTELKVFDLCIDLFPVFLFGFFC